MAEDEVVAVQEAARRIGRTVDTLRRWRRSGVIAFEQGTDEKGRALVRMGPLLAAAAGHAKETRPRASLAQTPTHAPVPVVTAAELAAVRAHLAEVQRDKGRLETEVAELRRLLADSRERVAVLERELNGGVRGLLKRAFRP
jgi:transposase-like protein